ncbi:aspartate/glutamate racemase family protein [Pseudooceanicola aestuarii]|uniref:aspartate/glutamate racemase family protein n=1 Tax=Pseudooceanicola aestuarii TaxID=2697319 RepID=UPI0013D235BF|nr:aspartate/glutamate racemase family protein [Pseudooceanicola aestuarii]
MRLLYLNPNSTEAMTDSMVAVARDTAPDADVLGWTNHLGPPAIQGPEDGAAAIKGMLSLLPKARATGVDAIVIGCFDDTGLARMRAAAHCPVIGIGQAAMSLATLHSDRFGIVTTLDISVPVIAANVDAYGHRQACFGVFASGLPVLEVEQGGQAVEDRLAITIATARSRGAGAVVLGCAGMSRLRQRLSTRTGSVLIDGVVASAFMARAVACA